MSKHITVDTADGPPLAKRRRTDPPDSPPLDDSKDIEDGDDETTETPQTLNSDAEPDSPATAATTPRAKFPSDFKTLVCPWLHCPKTFNRPARLRDHLNSHTNLRPFKCPYDDCDKDYIEDKHLKQHIKAVHTKERNHICPREGCGKRFVTGTRLKRHQAVHEGADRFRCSDCGQSFRKRDTLNKHVRQDHRGLPAFQCPTSGCSCEFETKAALKRHKEQEHGEIKFWCAECGSTDSELGAKTRLGFRTEALLQAHMKREHQQCMFCDFRSPSQWALEQHVEEQHSGKSVDDRKTHACSHENCGKSFTRKSNLTAHVRTAHEGLRFLCGTSEVSAPDLGGWTLDQGCGNKFSTKARMEDHIRYVHLGQERPKIFRTQNTEPPNMLDEISGAALEAKKTIGCPLCPEAFGRHHDLDVHLTKHHVADPNTSIDADPASLLEYDQLVGEPRLFDQRFGEGDAWPEDLSEEEIFAAQMEDCPAHDEWQEDEANMLLLARGISDLDEIIDPTLEAI